MRIDMFKVGDIVSEKSVRSWNSSYKIIEKVTHFGIKYYKLQSIKLRHVYIDDVSEDTLLERWHKVTNKDSSTFKI